MNSHLTIPHRSAKSGTLWFLLALGLLLPADVQLTANCQDISISLGEVKFR